MILEVTSGPRAGRVRQKTAGDTCAMLVPNRALRRYVPLVIVAWSGSTLSAAEPAGIAAVEKAATEWVKVRAETVRIETEWETERGLLATTVEGLKERAAMLEDRRDHLRAKTADERSELTALEEKRTAGAADLAAAEERMKTLDAQLLALRPKLPPRLASALEFSFKSLEGGELSPGERMQLTISVLNRCAQFNGAVTCGEEVLELQGEPGPKAVETIYWGLSHGYVLDRATGKAWLGTPGGEEWSWTPAPDAVKAVERLIAIYNDQHDPELVAVPARLAGAAQR